VGITTFIIKEGQNLNFALPAENILALVNQAASEGTSSRRSGPEKPAVVADLCEVEASESDKWICRGDEAKKIDDYKEATEAYQKAIQLDPQNDIAHSALGLILEERGALQEAIAELRTAVRLTPDALNHHLRLARALRKQGDLDGAIAEYREAVRLKPDFVDARLDLGNALLAKGELDAGIAEMQLGSKIKSRGRLYTRRTLPGSR
jgi:tetratricopeptide (TPR) repeat protein